MSRIDQLNITILDDVISKKNSKQIRIKKNVRFIAASNAWERYEKHALYQLLRYKKWEGTYPVIVEMCFYRKTLRLFDLDNMITSIQDVLVKAKILESDSMRHVIPKIRDLGWSLDRRNPRTEIVIVSYN
jgi:Holliday junction resolvase RusA-like endonuclease